MTPATRTKRKNGQPYGSSDTRTRSPLILFALLFALWFIFLVAMAILRSRAA